MREKPTRTERRVIHFVCLMLICIVSEVMTGSRDFGGQQNKIERKRRQRGMRKQGWRKILPCKRKEGRQIEKKRETGARKSGIAKNKMKTEKHQKEGRRTSERETERLEE